MTDATLVVGLDNHILETKMRKKIKTFLSDVICRVRVYYYRFMGITIGKNCFISAGAHIDVGLGRITIGNKVSIASGSWILGHTHRRPQKEGQETKLEDYVTVNVNAVVLPGIKVGENSMVGAGSVITKDVPPNVVVMGNPARVIWRNKKRDQKII